jgi:glycosyltransferase involved in cell wall biosynthesis
VLRLVKGLADRGYDLFCTVSGWNNGDYKRELADMGVPYQELFLGWYYLRKPAWSLNSLRHAPTALADYRRLLKRFQPDLVFHSTYRSLVLLGLMIGRKNVLVAHDRWPRAWERALIRFFDNRVLTYIAISAFMRSELIRAGLRPGKVETIYNSADFGSRMRSESSSSIGNAPVLGIVGQVSERKGHHIAVEALARVRERNPDLTFRLKIFGTGSEQYISRVKQLTIGQSRELRCGRFHNHPAQSRWAV